MAKHQEQKRKKDLGIFYTPPEVVGFIFDILNIWKGREEKETGRWGSKKHYPSVIDPACGEGIFLKKAVDGGFTSPSYIWGIDLDGKVKKRWEKITLLKSFGSKANLNFHFYHQDGLMPVPEKRVGHKKGGMNQYDAVVGNPPYGGVGLGETELTDNLITQLAKFEILPQDIKTNLTTANTQGALFVSDKKFAIKPNAKQRLKAFSIEILFLERFIQLTKPGGWIAVIIPDGILTNSNSHFVREFIAEKTKVEAIISLPRETFKQAGTSAKTSILFLRKLKEKEKPSRDYFVFLASVEKINEDNFQKIVKFYQKLYNLKGETMNKTNLVQITKDQTDKEVVMVRADKTLKEMMEEKPASRWSPEYWHPKYEELMQKLTSTGLKLTNSKEIMLTMTNGNRDREWAKSGNDRVRFIQVVNVLNTGIDFEAGDQSKHYAKKGGLGDPERSRLQNGDMLLISGATGSIGRACVLAMLPEQTNISQDINLIRLNSDSEISKYYFTLFILSSFGSPQLERFSKGVSGQIKVTFDHIQSIKIPVLPDPVQDHIESEYKKMSAHHDKAMEAKKDNDKIGYKNNIEIAEKMLKDLISKTEAVIRGERGDI